MVIELHFHRDSLPNKKHISERYNYSSMHGKQLVAFHVPQVLQELCNIDQYFSIIQPLYHTYPSLHIYWLENFLDDGCHDLFSLFLTTNQHFVVAMQKLQFHMTTPMSFCHKIGQNTKNNDVQMNVTDCLFHALIR
jgi:hypothetical protein